MERTYFPLGLFGYNNSTTHLPPFRVLKFPPFLTKGQFLLLYYDSLFYFFFLFSHLCWKLQLYITKHHQPFESFLYIVGPRHQRRLCVIAYRKSSTGCFQGCLSCFSITQQDHLHLLKCLACRMFLFFWFILFFMRKLCLIFISWDNEVKFPHVFLFFLTNERLTSHSVAVTDFHWHFWVCLHVQLVTLWLIYPYL